MKENLAGGGQSEVIRRRQYKEILPHQPSRKIQYQTFDCQLNIQNGFNSSRRFNGPCGKPSRCHYLTLHETMNSILLHDSMLTAIGLPHPLNSPLPPLDICRPRSGTPSTCQHRRQTPSARINRDLPMALPTLFHQASS